MFNHGSRDRGAVAEHISIHLQPTHIRRSTSLHLSVSRYKACAILTPVTITTTRQYGDRGANTHLC
jgi:hypothetical protein